MDGANPSFIRALKGRVDEDTQLRETDIILQEKLSIIIRSAVLTTEHVCDSCTV